MLTINVQMRINRNVTVVGVLADDNVPTIIANKFTTLWNSGRVAACFYYDVGAIPSGCLSNCRDAGFSTSRSNIQSQIGAESLCCFKAGPWGPYNSNPARSAKQSE
jgi:hypothetical protein